MKPLAPLAICLMFAALPLMAQTTSADGPAVDSATSLTITQDADFVALATSGNLLEIMSGTLALERATTAPAKAFAQQMIADHTAAGRDLAKAAGVAEPDLTADQTAMLHPDHAALLDQLARTEGAEFDTAYGNLQLLAHEQSVALFQNFATNGQEGPVKQFAELTLPKLQEHFLAAQELVPAP